MATSEVDTLDLINLLHTKGFWRNVSRVLLLFYCCGNTLRVLCSHRELRTWPLRVQIHCVTLPEELYKYRVIKKSLCTLLLYCNHQVHRDFLIALYYSFK